MIQTLLGYPRLTLFLISSKIINLNRTSEKQKQGNLPKNRVWNRKTCLDLDSPIPLANLERIRFPIGAGSQVVDPPLREARRRFDSVSWITHPVRRKSQDRRDFMDTVEQTLEQKLSRFSQIDNSHNAQFSLPHTHTQPFSLCFTLLCFPLFLSLFHSNTISVSKILRRR